MIKILNWLIFAYNVVYPLFLLGKIQAYFYENFEVIKSIIDIFSSIGVFLIGCIGLSQWRKEIKFKNRNELSEKITIDLITIEESIQAIRKSWKFQSLGEWVFDTDDPEIDIKNQLIITYLYIDFDLEIFEKRIKNLDTLKFNLERKLRIAATLWNVPEVGHSGKELSKLINNFRISIFRIGNNFKDNGWEFRNEKIEDNKDLQLIFYFDSPTKHKSSDELNSLFQTRLDAASKPILEHISKYLYP